jgi:hypothetical protein
MDHDWTAGEGVRGPQELSERPVENCADRGFNPEKRLNDCFVERA